MKKIITLITVLLVIGIQTADAQCLPRSAYYSGELIPSLGETPVLYELTHHLGEYFRMPVLNGASYTISTCPGSVDTQITGFENDITNTNIFYNDDNGVSCAGSSASIAHTPNFTGYIRASVNQYPCITTVGNLTSVEVSQYNNLAFTSSTSNMCAGETYVLTATPFPVGSAEAGAGDLGTFSGPGVSGNVFTAPTAASNGLSVHTITYTFGYCSVSQEIFVYTDLGPVADAGPDQLDLCGNLTFLNGSNSSNGFWSIISGAGAITDIYDPTSTITGLTQGATTILEWSSDYGACSSLDQVSIAIETTLPVPDIAPLAAVNSNCPVTLSTPTATDNCAGNMSATSSTSFPISVNGTTTVTWLFDDGNGNSITQTQDVIITPLDNSVTDNGGSLLANATGVTYQWLDCDNGMAILAGETNQSFTPTTNGNYSVEISNGTCAETSSCYFVQVIGINELSQNQVLVYPNPTNGEVTFKSSANIEKIEIVDITGKVVIITSNSIKLNLTHLNQGVYFAKIYFDENSFIQKRIVKN